MRRSLVVVVLSALLAAGCTSTVAGAPAAAPPDAGGCVPNTAPAGFSDGQGRFGLTPPKGWESDTSGKFGNAATFVDPQPDRAAKGRFAANIGVRVADARGDLAAAVAGVREGLKAINEYASTTDEALAVGSCKPAHMFGGTFTDAGSGLKLQNLQVLVVHANSVIVVTGSALESNWTDHEKELDAAVRSLTVGS
jgi:hypothetical protein